MFRDVTSYEYVPLPWQQQADSLRVLGHEAEDVSAYSVKQCLTFLCYFGEVF